MAESTETTKATETSLSRLLINLARYYLAGHRGFIVLAVVAFAAGAVFHWDWLVAAGIAPLLVALAPCAVMCALGLCMRKMGGKACSSTDQAPQASVPTAPPEKLHAESPPAETRNVMVNADVQDPSAMEPGKEKTPPF